jgi:hypothetical protein
VCGAVFPPPLKKKVEFLFGQSKIISYLCIVRQKTIKIMGVYETELGYQVRETINGLDVTENGEFVCELYGKTLNDYRTDRDDELSDIDDDRLEADIKKTIETDEIIDNW